MSNIPTTHRIPIWLGIVTLTSANTNYDLYALINTTLQAQTGRGSAIITGDPREFLIMANPGVDGSGSNTNDILVGDSNLSATNYGFILSVGSSVPFRSDRGNSQLQGMFVRSAGSSQKLCVSVFGA